MRIVFMGTPEFAVPTLDALVTAGHDVCLVVAQPDRPSGRGQQERSPPVAARARALGLPLAQPKAVKSGPFPERMAALSPDVAVVVAYGRILPPALLAIPRHGCVNVHASLLPRWRGAAPIQHAILAGDPFTGVCSQRMEEGLDTGPIYLRSETPIGPHETSGELHDRLAVLSAAIAVETLVGLSDRVPASQDDAAATVAPLVHKEDGRIDWRWTAIEIDRRVRAMTPWPGGFVPTAAGPIKLLSVRPVADEGTSGAVLSVRPLVVAAGTGALELLTVQGPGRRPVTGAEYANGARLRTGDKFPS